MNEKIIVLADNKLYGPFASQEIAHTWLKNTGTKGGELFSTWPADDGTADRAHECGTRLVGIDEATKQTSRKASGT